MPKITKGHNSRRIFQNLFKSYSGHLLITTYLFIKFQGPSLIRQKVSINDSQSGFVPGRGTTDAIFVVRQLQEKYLAANKRLYMAFVDLEKAFDQVPRKVIWWVLRKLGVEEWIVRLVQGMYANVRSRVRAGEEFEVKVGVHQGSVIKISPLLFIIVLEASALGSPGRTSMPMTLLSLLNRLRNVSGGS